MPTPELARIRARFKELQCSGASDASAIEERDALIEALLEHSHRLDTVIDAIPYAVALRDLDGRYLVANAAMPANSGLDVPAEDFLGKVFTDVQPAGGESAHVKVFERVVRDGLSVFDFQYESAVTPGRWRSINAVAVHDDEGQLTSVLTVGRDVTDRVRDATEVRESEVQFRELAELSPDAMIIQVDGRIRYANESARRMLGAARVDDLIGQDSLSIVAPHWREYVLTRRQQTEADGSRAPYTETCHQRLDGTTFPSEMIAGPIVWEGAKGTVNIIHDITARKAAEDAVRASEARTTNLIRNLPGIAYRVTFIVDESGQRHNAVIDFVSNASLELLGYPPADLKSIDLLTLLHPDDALANAPGTLARHRAGEQVEVRSRIRCADGSWRWMLARSRRIAMDGNNITVEGLLVDIDAQVRAEEALTERSKLLQTVIDTVPAAGITMRDRDERYMLINANAARFFNLDVPIDEFVGKRIDELIPDWQPTIGESVHEEVLRTGKPVVGKEYESVLIPGLWRLLHAAPVFNTNGEVDAVVQVSLDITQQKIAELALMRHRDTLEDVVEERTQKLSEEILERKRAEQALARNERLAAIGQVAATVSHELRNPLGTINTSMYLLDKESPEPSERRQRVRKRIQRSIDRCVRIIDEMLEYARARDLDREKIDFDAWCGDLLDELEVPDRVQVTACLESNAKAYVDVDRMRQAVVNIVQNGWQAALASIEPPGVASVAVTTSTDGVDLYVHIADNGPGIEAANLERIFEPLFSTKSFGVGLGLPLVKRLVEEHGGSIEVDSSSAGTTFKLRIPLQRPR